MPQLDRSIGAAIRAARVAAGMTQAQLAALTTPVSTVSCSLNWGGTKTLIDYTTNVSPGFLPGGSGTAILKTLNSPPNDIVSFGLSQVNMSAMQRPGQSYVQAALAAGYQMGVLQQQIQTHEKLRHWTQFLVDFVANNRDNYDVGTVMERQAIHGGSESDARNEIDLKVRIIDFNYIQPGQGGALEVTSDPKSPFPLIADLPLNNANCALH